MTQKKLRVGVIFGGKSGEHEVSLMSAKNVMDAMDKDKYEVVPIGIAKSGVWLTGPTTMQQLTAEASLPPKLAMQARNTSGNLASFLSHSIIASDEVPAPLDVVFPVLHGPMGEDGTVQGFLELADIPYVGCGVTGSATAMDKAISKDIFRAHGLSIVPHCVILRRVWRNNPDQIIAELENTLTYPLFAKPANLGSSVGITKANNRTELHDSLDEAAKYDRKIVVESGVDAREVEVSVLGNDQPQASVPGEVIPSRDFYSYAAKYVDDDSELIIPASLTPEQTEHIQEMAITAFQALDCTGLARVDFLVEKESGHIFINEVNTMPGFTSISMYPKLWAASGLSYPKLIDQLIALAQERYVDRQQDASSFDVSNAE